MSFPERSSYPTTIWDGGSSNRSSAVDNEGPLDSHREPSPEDFSRTQAEIIATQTALSTVRILVGAGTAALATTATSGHGYIPTCAGTPTGVPATIAGHAALIYDTTAHKLWHYDAGWKTVGAAS